MTESERELFYRQVKEKVSRYHFLASQLLDQNHALIEHIFDFQVKTKTLLFNTLDKVKDIVSESDDEILVAKYQKWLSDKRLLASYYQMGVDQLAELHVNLEKIEVDIENQERVLAENIEAFEEVLPQDNLNWEYVLKSVKDDESIVEIIKIKEFKALIKDRENLFGFTDKTSYLAIIFNSGSEKVHYTFLGKRNLKEIDHLVVSQNSEEAYDSYWRPVMEKTNETKWIRLIPDGIFSKINPNQYRIDQKNYVIDKKYVTYLTSVHDLFRPDVATFIEKFCLIQNPTFDESTLESLSRYHFVERPTLEFIFSNWRINTYDRQDASEFRLRTTYNPTILHISAPVFLESQKPFISDKSGLSELLFNSGIYLSGVSDSYDKYGKGISSIPENDGLLMIDEVMKLELERTRLVFLSSVELEREKVNGGDGYYGLLRAFSVAGVRNVITSTAIVDEAKKNELIELFYQRFLETDQIQASFRYAQLEIKKKYEDANVWGAFIVTGSGS